MSHYGIQSKGTSPILKRPVRPLSSQSPHLSVYKEGGRIGLKKGGEVKSKRRKEFEDKLKGPPDPHKPRPRPEWMGKKQQAKKGGWIQKATKSIKERGTEGKCTPITKPGCTGRAKALAKTFKKMAKKRKNA